MVTTASQDAAERQVIEDTLDTLRDNYAQATANGTEEGRLSKDQADRLLSSLENLIQRRETSARHKRAKRQRGRSRSTERATSSRSETPRKVPTQHRTLSDADLAARVA